MDWTSTDGTQNNLLLRFLTALFAMVGFHAGEQLFRRDSALTPYLFLRTYDAPANLRRYLRRAALTLLRLGLRSGQARSHRAIGPPDEDAALMLPEMQPKDDCELLTVQNVAGRVAALYRAWDELEAQAGRLVRWRRQFEDQIYDHMGGEPSDGFVAWLFEPSRVWPLMVGVIVVLGARVQALICLTLLFVPLGQPARASPDTS